MEIFREYRRRRNAELKAYYILCDLQASMHGFFGNEARKRLAQIGLSGEALRKKQEAYLKDPSGTRISLEKALINS